MGLKESLMKVINRWQEDVKTPKEEPRVRTPMTVLDEVQLDNYWSAWVRLLENSPEEQKARQTLSGTMKNLELDKFGSAWDEAFKIN